MEEEEEEEQNDESWRSSAARNFLIADLKNGTIPMERDDSVMTIQQAYDSRPEYQATDRSKWAGRLRSVRMELEGEEEDDNFWESSEAKKILIEELENGVITMERDDSVMTIQEAYDSRPEYQATNRYKWAARLRSTRTHVGSAVARAETDSDAYHHDDDLYPRQTHNHLGQLRWHGSEAARLLRVDVASGFYASTSVESLYIFREEYEDFELELFRRHVHQEKNRLKRLNDPNYKRKI